MRSPSAGLKGGGDDRKACKTGGALELLEYVVGRGNFELARRLDVYLSCNAILDDDGEALAPGTHSELGAVEFESQRLGVGAVAVRQHQDLVADAAVLAPCVHHEHIVHGSAGDGIHTLGLDLVRQLDEARQV